MNTKTTWKILGEDVVVAGKEGNMFVEDINQALELCLFAGMTDEAQANRRAKRNFIFEVDFRLLEQVNEKLQQNILYKLHSIDCEIDDHVGHTQLNTMAEFDGGQALHQVETQMYEQLIKKESIGTEDIAAIPEDVMLNFYNNW